MHLNQVLSDDIVCTACGKPDLSEIIIRNVELTAEQTARNISSSSYGGHPYCGLIRGMASSTSNLYIKS